jgi:predicted DNA binding protein
MGTIVDTTVKATDFALADTFEAVPEATFESVRIVAHESERTMPYFWTTAEDGDALDDALAADDTVTGATRVTAANGRYLYRLEWHSTVQSVLRTLLARKATLLEATCRSGRWHLRLLFPDHDSISATNEACETYGVDLTVQRVKRVQDLVGSDSHDLSEQQREALRAAIETEYYGVPREMTLEGLAEKLGVSHQALSERLRRGHRNLVTNTLCDTPGAMVRDENPATRPLADGSGDGDSPVRDADDA